MATSLTNNKLTLNNLDLNAILGGNILVGAGTDGVETSGTKTFPSGTWRGFYCNTAQGYGIWKYTCSTGVSFSVKYVYLNSSANIGGEESSSASPNSLSYFLNNTVIINSEGRKVA